jgi:hypothetical protein
LGVYLKKEAFEPVSTTRLARQLRVATCGGYATWRRGSATYVASREVISWLSSCSRGDEVFVWRSASNNSQNEVYETARTSLLAS